MSKADAADFLRKLAQSKSDDPNQPRVIVVRSSRETKSFVASALEQLELAGKAIDSSAATDGTAELVSCFESISYSANQHGLAKLSDAIRHAETLAALTKLADQAEQERLNSAFSAILKYLSAAMLRVYVDGGDHNCSDELAVIRRIVTDSARKLGFAVNTHAGDSRVLN